MKTQSGRTHSVAKPLDLPPPKFRTWWMPHGYNIKTGAQIGGHQDALRKCVRTDTGEIAYFGIRVEQAWLCQRYRDEYHKWIRDGMLEREYEVDGTAASIEKQKAVWTDCLKMMTT